ncbi:MAG: hypothetical protein WC010_02455 [Candidatus Absconditabacterales bacterium]
MKKKLFYAFLAITMISVQHAYSQCTVSITASSDTICQGSSTTLTANGSGSISNYVWNTGESGPAMTSVIKTPLVTTTYSVIVTGPFGCNATDSITIVVVTPGSVVITPSGPTTVCQGAWVLMNANVGDSHQWYRNGVLIPGAINSAYSDTLPGNYFDMVSLGPCSSIMSNIVLVTVNPLPNATFTPNVDGTDCPFAVTPLVAGSAPGYTYQWYVSINDPGPYNPIPGETGQTFTPTMVGDWYYRVQVTDANMCTNMSNY